MADVDELDIVLPSYCQIYYNLPMIVKEDGYTAVLKTVIRGREVNFFWADYAFVCVCVCVCVCE